MAQAVVPVLPGPVRWGFVLLALALLAWGSLSTSSTVDRAAESFPYGDEGMHIVAYAGLAGTVTYAWLPAEPKPLRRGAVVFVAVLVVGGVLEALQAQVPGRTPDLGDLVADGLGAMLAFVWDALAARFVDVRTERT